MSGGGCRVLLGCDFHLRYSANLAGGLVRAGAEVALLNRDHDLEFGGAEGAADAYVDAAIEGARRFRVTGRVRSLGGWRDAVGVRRRVRAFRPTVLHVQESVGNDPRLLLAARLGRRPFAITIHDPSPHPGDRVAWQDRPFNSMLVRRAKLVFVHGESLREELLENFSPGGEVVVVPHGVTAGEASPLPAAPHLLFFGRISRYKGIDTLLDAMAKVWERAPAATLTIAGSGELEPHPLLDDPRVEARNEYLPDDALPDLFRAARVVVLPYRQASQSGVGSMVKPYARPLIVTEVGGLPELVADGSGLAVPAEDPGALAAAILRVVEDDDLAAGLAGAAVRAVEEESGWDRVAELTLAAYREHLGAVGCA